MDKKIVKIHKIGDVEISKKRAARRISISVKPGGNVKMTLPIYTSYKAGEEFLLEKTEWIKLALKKINSKQTIFTPGTSFNTYNHSLKIKSSSSVSTFQRKIMGNNLIIIYNSAIKIDNIELQKYIRESLVFIMRKEAKDVLPEKVNLLAKRYGFTYNRVFIKNTKSRWGSCSSKNNINLCLQLMRLPDNLINYVVLHELVHTIHKNHGKTFWKLLDDVTGNAKGLDNMLKEYSISVY